MDSVLKLNARLSVGVSVKCDKEEIFKRHTRFPLTLNVVGTFALTIARQVWLLNPAANCAIGKQTKYVCVCGSRNRTTVGVLAFIDVFPCHTRSPRDKIYKMHACTERYNDLNGSKNRYLTICRHSEACAHIVRNLNTRSVCTTCIYVYVRIECM